MPLERPKIFYQMFIKKRGGGSKPFLTMLKKTAELVFWDIPYKNNNKSLSSSIATLSRMGSFFFLVFSFRILGQGRIWLANGLKWGLNVASF